MKKIAILGASGHGKVLADLAEILGYEITFFDDNHNEKRQLEIWNVEGDSVALASRLNEFPYIVIAIGDNSIRQKKYQHFTSLGAKFPCLIHPEASISKYAIIGKGTVVFSKAVINAFAVIKDGVIVNTASVIEHDCSIGNFAHIGPNASLAGGVKVGDRAWIGISACAKQLVEVGEDAVIGAGSVVINDILPGKTVYGIPAKSCG